MNSQLNLRGLALERSERSRQSPRHRRAWLSRYIVPGGIVLGFLGLLGWGMRDQLVSRRPVTVIPVVVTRAEIQAAGTTLFQAAGWIEPRPTPTSAAALTEGVVESLLVVEGQAVAAGEPVAKLIDIDARLALQEAQATLDLREAEVRSAEGELKAAKLRIEFPVHLEAQLADAESLLAKTQTELVKLPFLIKSAAARLDYARNNLDGKQSAGLGIAGRTLQLAESEFAAAQADLSELQQRGPSLQREEAALQKKKKAVADQLMRLVEESRQLESALASLQAAKAIRDRARLAVEKANLNLDRTIVRSPGRGTVMQLIAHPGTRVMGLDANATRSASTVVTLYDPEMLQVRADVRLEDVPRVQPGQPVEVQTASSKETIHGTVLRATSSANIQKNTLEVKIALEHPPATVRPEMLVTATFQAPPPPETEQSQAREIERLLIPRQLVEKADGAAVVWVADANSRARRRSVQLGQSGTEALVEVVDGLTATDKLIAGGREGLAEGDPVHVTGEDASLGISSR
ncbi:efflux RND transporter periplasmic adaptor subunit [Planctomicrobium piriforme]|uniref:Barrel-sandwich domain of CusB or HlyD membrane-fusion n=1 Tax=Planctomicrobium piriforme TaxID=1576369 RepID=A0A1I3RDS5_9PLAN|nr:HlyD family efflux transporter periplasmic adaptor subunit [Planctomicrobium piriforme]SFJ43346.1 Barrel-sandwich domain of CusB or HlyD membrane-fusion [Planctomicrobium piriforme]